jgi:hypothetical protein
MNRIISKRAHAISKLFSTLGLKKFLGSEVMPGLLAIQIQAVWQINIL